MYDNDIVLAIKTVQTLLYATVRNCPLFFPLLKGNGIQKNYFLMMPYLLIII